jgi:hypothetical protein
MAVSPIGSEALIFVPLLIGQETVGQLELVIETTPQLGLRARRAVLSPQR